jgi:hypothetical protein
MTHQMNETGFFVSERKTIGVQGILQYDMIEIKVCPSIRM